MISVFTNDEMAFRCVDTDLKNSSSASNYKNKQILSRTDFLDERVWINYTQIVYDADCRENFSQLESCEKIVWSKKTDELRDGQVTIFYDLDLTTCEGKNIAASTVSAVMWGFLVGCLFAGVICDAFGRRLVLLVSSGLIGFTFLALPFSSSANMMKIFVFIRVVLAQAKFNATMVLSAELISKNKQMTTFMANAGYSLGYFLVTAFAYYFPNWVHQCYAYTIITFLTWPFCFMLPESPQWLRSRGRFEEAKQIDLQVSEKNKGSVDPAELEKTDSISEFESGSSNQKSVGEQLSALFKNRIIRTRVLLVSLFIWPPITTLYYAFTLETSSLPGSPYFNSFLSCLIDLLAYAGSGYLIGLLGRRNSMMLTFGITSAASLVSALFSSAAIYMSWVGKIGITCNFNVIYVFIPELFTTGMRGLGMAIPNGASRVMSLASPYMKNLKDLENGHSIFWGFQVVITGLAMLACAFLPETGKMDPPETEEDIRKQQKYRLIKLG